MNDKQETTEKVTGKKILADCVILARDVGVFLYDIGRSAYTAVKTAIATEKTKKENKKEKAAEKTGTTSKATA